MIHTASCNSGGAKRHWSWVEKGTNTEAPKGNQSAIFIGEEGAHTHKDCLIPESVQPSLALQEALWVREASLPTG